MSIENVPDTFDILEMSRSVTSRSRRRWLIRAAAGSALVAAGARMRGWIGALSAGCGVYLLLGAVRERNLSGNAARPLDWSRRLAHRRRHSGKLDQVDEASWESFPASDPSSPATSGRRS